MSQKKKLRRDKIVRLPNEDMLMDVRPRVRFKRALFSFFVMLVIMSVVYMETSYSRLSVVNFYGNNMLTRSELISLIEIDEDELFLGIRLSEIQMAVEGHPVVSQARVSRVWPNRMRIEIIEHEVGACALVEGEMFHILTDGVLHHESDGMRANCDEMMIHGLTRSEVIVTDEDEVEAEVPSLFVRQLVRVEPEIRDLIQMIEHDPLYGDIHRFSLSLIDGNTVKVTSHTMPDYLNLYRDLLSYLEPGLTGVFHLDVGNTFVPHE